MYVSRELPYQTLIVFTLRSFLYPLLWATAVVCVYRYVGCKFMAIPFLPIATIGTALALYLGFKNNSSYERLWEARRVWGGIVNDSRAFAAMLNSYVSNIHNKAFTAEELQHQRELLAKRHMAWIQAHKFYLLNKRQTWEHNMDINNKAREKLNAEFEISSDLKADLLRYLSEEETQAVMSAANPAALLLNNQAKALLALRDAHVIEDFRLFEMQNHLNKLFEYQGQNERIKNFPFPRQYSWMVNVSVFFFCLLLPFGLLNEMKEQGEWYIWLTIPFCGVISWFFLFMNTNSDYSENPFSGLVYDVPITSMARNIEIDMRQMLEMGDVPEAMGAKNGILM